MNCHKIRALLPLVLAGSLLGCQPKNRQVNLEPVMTRKFPIDYEPYLKNTLAVWSQRRSEIGCVGIGDSVDFDFNGTETSVADHLRQAMFLAHRGYFSICQKPASPEREITLAVAINPRDQQKSYLSISGSDVLIASDIMIYRRDRFLQITAIAADGLKLVKSNCPTFVGAIGGESMAVPSERTLIYGTKK